jgi:hypothetical protein
MSFCAGAKRNKYSERKQWTKKEATPSNLEGKSHVNLASIET